MIKRVERSDGKRRIDIIARDDGLFQSIVHKFLDEEKAWVPARTSGIFDNADAAEQALVDYLNS
ncbi:MAG TPA: hypothetical protein VII56_06810 [Rhizomicrobium sp.]